MAGPAARPREDQTAAVAALVEQRARVLVVQATGWGKSAVYWAATSALRAAGKGPTLIVSPLLALMRDQVGAAAQAGLRAATVNSTNLDDWDAVFDDIAADRLDVLLVSPERLGNAGFARRLPGLLAATGLVVIDEAHCISDWGFDFRPDYQRLAKTLLGIGADTPVLATTATANSRVTLDIARQLGPQTLTFRGSLARSSLRLAVVPGLDPLERYAWVADALDSVRGFRHRLRPDGRRDRAAGGLPAVLRVRGGGLPRRPGHRPCARSIEDALRRNALKAVVATSALGMGYDKPDLAFCIHVGSPASPVAYYQQVGRAGRALDEAVAVLLPAETDEQIWAYFATAGVPDEERVGKILDALAQGPQTLVELENATTIRRGRLEGLLKILAVDEVVQREGSAWALTGKPWTYDAERWQALAQVREREAGLMRAFAAGTGLPDALPAGSAGRSRAQRLRALQRVHGPASRPGRAARRRAHRGGARVRTRAGRDHRAAQALAVGGRAQGPHRRLQRGPRAGLCRRSRLGRGAAAAVRRAGRARARSRCWTGWSACSAAGGAAGVPGRWPWCRCRRRCTRSWCARWRRTWRRWAGCRWSTRCAWRAPTPDADLASGAKVAALLEALVLRPEVAVPAGPLLLIDARYRSGWSVTVAAALLREAGAAAVLPLVLHQLP